MEPAKVKVKYAFNALVIKVEEKYENFNYRRTQDGSTECDTRSLGWYVQFEGSSESLCFGPARPPFEEGCWATITIERRD